MKATIRGINSEAAGIFAYKNGDRSNYTARIMMDVIASGVEFNKHVKRDDVDINGIMDGYYNDGNGTIHIFEMKNGKRFDEKYQAQVNRYAYQVSATVDFHTVITYVIYQNHEEVTIEKHSREDVKANFFNTKENAEGRSWARIAASKPGYKEAKNARAKEIRDARSEDEIKADSINSKAKRDARSEDEIKADKARRKANRDNDRSRAKVSEASKRFRDNMTEDKKESVRAIARAKTANRTPEQIAADSAKEKVKSAAKKAAMTSEEKADKVAKDKAYNAAYNTPERRAAAKANQKAKRAARTPEQKAAESAARRAKIAAMTPEQKEAKRIASAIKRAARTPEQVEAKKAADRAHGAVIRAAKKAANAAAANS